MRKCKNCHHNIVQTLEGNWQHFPQVRAALTESKEELKQFCIHWSRILGRCMCLKPEPEEKVI